MSMADNTNSTQAKRGGEKWWGVAKAIAYELKPFSLPTVEDVSNAGKSVRTNVGQIAAEIKRVAPEAVSVVKAFDPLRALGLFAWLCGWALFIWIEFGECVMRQQAAIEHAAAYSSDSLLLSLILQLLLLSPQLAGVSVFLLLFTYTPVNRR